MAVHKCSTTEETPRVVDEGESEGTAATQTTTRRQVEGVDCRACGRKFRRPGDLKRHKCTAEREKPVQEQRGAVQCERCSKWFRSKGGLAVHKCERRE